MRTQNTMGAFRNAARLDVEELEADVQLTADGELVLLHDDTLERSTDCTSRAARIALDRSVTACEPE